MKQIPQVPTETPPKEDKLADRVTRRNPKVYDGNCDPVVLEEWVRGMEKIFTVVEVPKEKKVNIRTYYLSGEADIWWNTVEGGLVGFEFNWSKLLAELREKFYPFVAQRQKEKEFLELKMSASMSVLQYASKFTELSRCVPEFASSERLKMRRFEEDLALYIWNQLAGQSILTYQELYERAAEAERVKTEFRALNPINQKRKGIERGAPQ